MKVTVTPDKQSLYIQTQDELEKIQLDLSLNVKIKNHWNDRRVKMKVWDGKIYNYKNNMISIGLWKVLLDICEEYGLEINYDFLENIIDNKIRQKDVTEYFQEYFKNYDKKPSDHQLTSIYMFLKYRKMIAELATNAGKTMIIFMLFRYLKHCFDLAGVPFKMVLVVPNIQLILQTHEDWLELAQNGERFKILSVAGDFDHHNEDVDDYDIVVGTFQSLTKKDDKFFSKFRCLMVDESHTTKSASVKNIAKKCVNAVYKCGVSGTSRIKDNIGTDDDAESFTIQNAIGPKMYTIKSDHLINIGWSTPVEIIIFKLNYLNDDLRENLYTLWKRNKALAKQKTSEDALVQLLPLEKGLVVASEKRLNFVLDLLKKTKKNTLVLFSSVEKKYGQTLADRLKEETVGRDVFYIEGSTSAEIRQYYKNKMKEENNVILIASYGTFSTGISINNIHNIVFLESFKSEVIIKQSIGRGLRKMKNKQKVTVIDLVDDYRRQTVKNGKRVLKGTWKNHLYKHGEERKKLYKEENFPIILEKTINL